MLFAIALNFEDIVIVIGKLFQLALHKAMRRFSFDNWSIRSLCLPQLHLKKNKSCRQLLYLFSQFRAAVSYFIFLQFIFQAFNNFEASPIGCGCRIHRLHLYRGVRLPQQMTCGPVGSDCRIHRLHLYRGVRLPQQMTCGPVGSGCRIHQLHLCRGVRLPQQMSCDPVNSGYRIHRLHLCRGIRLSQ